MKRIRNFILCLRFPFLKRDYAKGYNYTWFDAIPEGWRKCFGIQMCKEIKRELKFAGWKLKNYVVSDVKEKDGELVWYDSGSPKGVEDILHKYEEISYHTCVVCGRPADCRSPRIPWENPYCKEHYPYSNIKPDEFYKDIPFYGWKGYNFEKENN